MSFSERNIAIACNPKRRKALQMGEDIALLLSGMNVQHTIFNGNWPSNWSSFTEIWIVGGDGTLNYFINQNKNIELPLTILAGGTGNDFHWMLYGNISVEEQVEKMLLGKAKEIDAGKCNDKLFMNGIGIGFDGKIVFDLLENEKKDGKISYKITVFKNVLSFKSFNCRLKDNQHNIQKKCLMISIANGSRYGGGFHVAPAAIVDDGSLDVYAIGKLNSLQRVRWLPVIEKGNHEHLPFVNNFRTNKIVIEAEKIIHAHADGEYFSDDKFVIECVAKKFQFIC